MARNIRQVAHRPLLRVAVLAVAVLAAPLTLPTSSLAATRASALPAPSSAPAAPSSITASQPGAAPDVLVSWRPSTSGGAPTGAIVQLYDVTTTAQYLTTVTCANGCTSVTFRYLAAGRDYEALMWPTNSVGAGVPVVSNVAELADSCASGACVSLDATKQIGAANHAASGFLHSLYPMGSDQTDLRQLGATMWRGAPTVGADNSLGWSSWRVAEADGVPTTLVLSDLWSAEQGAATPWSDWSAYRSWVSSTVRSIIASGHDPTYWEPYNEPGSPGYYGPSDFATVTPSLLLEQFLVTYQAIKSVVPGAQIIGPSLEQWIDSPVTPSASYRGFDMVTFLNFAAANHLRLAAISWHDIADFLSAYPGENSLSPQNLVDEVQAARQTVARLPALGSPKIFINEYEFPEIYNIPGWDVAYLAAITDAQVSSAVLTCWSVNCANPTLDGLLGTDGTSTMPDYWVRLAYAQMSGSMIATASTDDAVSALGAYNPATSTISGLVGRGVGCIQSPWCAATWTSALLAPSEQVTVKLTVPWSSGSVRVSQSDISGSVLAVLAAPDVMPVQTVQVAPAGGGTGTVSIPIPSFADGDAYAIKISRA